MEQDKASLRGKSILIAEDDSSLRNTVRDVLVSLGAYVELATDGTNAKATFDGNKNRFDLVLTDIRMPEMDGLQLLKHCKSQNSKAKFIIFTGFSELLEARSASELGADAFISKPFRLQELIKTITDVLDRNNTGDTGAVDQKYCRIRVDEFFSTTKLLSDIYVKVGADRYIKVAKEGTEIEIGRLHHFKEHKVEFLFVTTEDFSKYTGLTLKLARAVEQSSIPAEKKMRFYKQTSEMLMQQVFLDGIDSDICENARSMMENTIKMISANDNLFELLLNMQGRADRLYSHSLAVSMYSCLIAGKIGWSSTNNQAKIAMTGLLHDIGFKELPDGFHELPRYKMSAEEIRLYESHPTRSKGILASTPGMPSEVALIVGQHHEANNGQGYPLNLASARIHPLSKLLHFSDELAEKIAALEKPDHKTVQEILMDLFQGRREEFEASILAGAFDLFKIPRPAGLKPKVA